MDESPKGYQYIEYAVLASTVLFGIFIIGIFGGKLYIVRKITRAKGTPERVEDSFPLPLIILTWIGNGSNTK